MPASTFINSFLWWCGFLWSLPHELVHALALLLCGKRPTRIGNGYIAFKKGLSKAQNLFVTLLPLAASTLCFGVSLYHLDFSSRVAYAKGALLVLYFFCEMLTCAGDVRDARRIVSA